MENRASSGFAINQENNLDLPIELQPIDIEATVLSGRDLNVLTLFSGGMAISEISDCMGLPRVVVQASTRSVRERFGTKTTFGAVIRAMDQGVLTAAQLLGEEYDLSVVSDLTPAQRTALAAFVKRGDSEKLGEIVISLGYSPDTFENLLNGAVVTLGANSIIRAGVILNAAIIQSRNNQSDDPVVLSEARKADEGVIEDLTEGELRVLNLRAKGFRSEEIADELGLSPITIKNQTLNIFRKLVVNNASEAIIRALSARILDIDACTPEDFNPVVLRKLSPWEREILTLLAGTGGTNKQIAQALSMSEQRIKNYLTSMIDKTGAATREQLIIYYYSAFKKARIRQMDSDGDFLRDELFGADYEKHGKKRELSKRELEILIYFGKGSSSKEIAYELNISVMTIRNHSAAILRTLGAEDRTDAVLIGLQSGLIDLGDLVLPQDDLTNFRNLSNKEMEVIIYLLSSRQINSAIAGSFGVSEQTIKEHFSNIYKKTYSVDKTQMAVRFLEALRRDGTEYGIPSIELEVIQKLLLGADVSKLLADLNLESIQSFYDRIKKVVPENALFMKALRIKVGQESEARSA